MRSPNALLRFFRSTGGNRALVRIIVLLLVIIGTYLAFRVLPIGDWLGRLEAWTESRGAWGALAFGGAYVILAVLLIPGGALTIAAGAIFGLGLGFMIVSLASTTAAAMAFLIARYVARRAVLEQSARYPTFAAVDHAIGEGGWRIVVMLRLVPMFPFNVGNYLLGLTSVRFLPYVLASWVGMMPATVVYVYLGHIGRVGVEAAAGKASRHPLEWALLGLAGAAAIGVTVYLTRLTKRRLARQIDVPREGAEVARPSEHVQ